MLGIACKFAPAYSAEQIPVFVRELLKQGKRQEAIQALVQQRAPRGDAAKKRVDIERTLVARQFVTNEGFQIYQDGVNQLEAERFDEAREKFREALTREVDHVEVLVRLGQTEVLLDRSSSAKEYLDRALTIAPGETEARIWKGQALILDKKWPEAIEELKEATKEQPQSEVAVIALSRALRGSRQVDRANLALSHDLESNPFHLNVLVEWASALVEREKSEGLWKVRKELQLGLSRLTEYAKKSRKFESDLALPPKDKDYVKEKIEKLLKETDLKLASRGEST